MPNTPGFKGYIPQICGPDHLEARIKRIYKYMLKYNAKVIKQRINDDGWITIEFEVHGLPGYKHSIIKKTVWLAPNPKE